MNRQHIVWNRSRRQLSAALAVATLAAAMGCSAGAAEPARGAASPGAPSVTPASTPLGDPVPAPTGEPVLRLSGKIGATNGPEGLTLDRAMIDRLGVRDVELYEPFQKLRMRFRGVPFASLLRLARPDGSAATVHMVALDDFIADLPLDAALDQGVFLATGMGDGSPIPIEQGGPVRLVFLDGSDGASDTESWIWSMATVEVK